MNDPLWTLIFLEIFEIKIQFKGRCDKKNLTCGAVLKSKLS